MTRTALVLGGGGVTGIGWMLGLLKGLHDEGVDLTTADLVIGTSAGSVVAVQITSGRSLDDLYTAQLRPPDGETAAAFGLRELLTMAPMVLRPGADRARRRRIGQAARRAHPGLADARVDVISSRLRLDTWPDRDVRITTVDADTGDLVLLDRFSGVDVRLAVAASCAVPLVWPPVPAGGHTLVDGGVRSPVNADLAAGADTVVALAPIPRSVRRRHSLPAQLGRTGASRTAGVAPDAAARRAIGRNLLDPKCRAAAARAGLAQAPKVLDEIAGIWT